MIESVVHVLFSFSPDFEGIFLMFGRVVNSAKSFLRSNPFPRFQSRFKTDTTVNVAELAQAAQNASKTAPRTGLKGLLRTYLELSKFRLGSLVVVTTTAGFVVASGNILQDWREFDWAKCGWVTLGTTFHVAAANSLNQLIEINRDRLMTRTLHRPLVLGRISVLHGILFAVSCTLTGSTILVTKTNMLTNAMGMSNIVLYAFIYTPLKVLHPINTWIGAVVGAIPPMMGAAAAQKGNPGLGDLGWDAWLLGGVLFAWQISHFLSLSYFIRKDYAKAGYKMLSVTNPVLCAKLAMRYGLYLIPVGVAGYLLGCHDWVFALDAGLLGVYLAWMGREFSKQPGDLPARKMFKASLLYLPLVLIFAMVHAKPLAKRVGFSFDEKPAMPKTMPIKEIA